VSSQHRTGELGAVFRIRIVFLFCFLRNKIQIQIIEKCSGSFRNIGNKNLNYALFCLFPIYLASCAFFMWIRIQEANLLQIHADPDPKDWLGASIVTQTRGV
jgi:hypothetical protein